MKVRRASRSLLALALLLAGAPAQAQFFFPFFDNRPSAPPEQPRPAPPRKPRPKAPRPVAPVAPRPAEGAAAAPVVEGPPPPYEAQLLRLSEIMGAVAYLQSLCASTAGAQDLAWRDSMQNLMAGESAGPARREKLAGAYNHGLEGYRFSYRVCTPSARLARRLFLDEGARIAHDIAAQYRAN
jgi:uncharacterized protein (TIGR02301 family)